MKIRKKTITQKVIIILVISIILMMVIAGGFYYLSEKKNAVDQIQITADQTSNRISNSLIYPLWNFSDEEIEKAISFEIAAENVDAIILKDQNNNFLIGKIKDDGRIVNYYPSKDREAKLKTNMLIVKKKIAKDNEFLGEVQLFFTNKYLNQYLRILVVKVASLTVFLSILIVFVIFFSLKKFILNPLILLQSAVQRLNAAIKGEGDTNYRVITRTDDEIGMLGKNFNAMADDLTSSQQQLHHTVNRLQTLTDTTPDTVIIVNPEGKIIEINKTCIEMFGYTNDELLNLTISDLGAVKVSGYEDIINRNISLAIQGDRADFEWIARTKDGEPFPVDVRFRQIKLGEEYSILVVITDITERKRTEVELKESEERYRIAIEASSEGVSILQNEVHVYANRAFLDMFGYISLDEILGMPPYFDVHPDEHEREIGFARARIKGENVPSKYEFKGIRKDGTTIDVEVSANTIFYKGEKSTLLYFRDNTERKQAENALLNERQRFESLTESAPIGMAMIGEDGDFKYINPKFKELFGYELEDIPDGKTWFKKAYPDTEYRHKVISSWITDFKNMSEIKNKTKGWVFEVKCKNGSEKTISFFTARLAEGEYAMTCEDITERLRAEEILRESEEKFRSVVLESIGDGYFEVDLKGKILFINEALIKILEYSREELFGMDYNEYMDQESVKIMLKTFNEVYSKRESSNIKEWTITTKAGRKKDLESSISLIKNAHDKPIAFRCIARDITERKQAERALESLVNQLEKSHSELEIRVADRTEELAISNEELKKEIEERKRAQIVAEAANIAKSQFLANMSHELRTPMNHIIGFTELIADKTDGELNSTQEEYLNNVLQSSKHLLSLINDILNLSKMEAGMEKIQLGDVDLRAILNNSLTMIKEKVMKHRIGLSTFIDEGTPDSIIADERKLKQIIYNLLANAIKFTPDGGKILLRARKHTPNGAETESVEISIIDTGIGLKKEDSERIFNPFEQVDSSTNRKYAGTGLGLSITKKLVELHKGHITAESEGEGKGSTFRIVIPVQGEYL